jgi:hypothetical protein
MDTTQWLNTEQTNTHRLNRNLFFLFQLHNFARVSWQGWTVLSSGTTIDSPAISEIDSELHLVLRDSYSDTLWHYYINPANNAQSAWILLQGWARSASILSAHAYSQIRLRGGLRFWLCLIYGCSCDLRHRKHRLEGKNQLSHLKN